MMDTLLQIGLSNACITLGLAIVAVAVGTSVNRPQLTHMLWLLVFIKLVTPPMLNIPVMPDLEANAARSGYVTGVVSAQASIVAADPVSAVWSHLASIWSSVKPWLAMVWILGSLLALVWSLSRVVRFNRLLNACSRPASAEVRQTTTRIAARLGLTVTPDIRTTAAALSPMVWWTGGRVRVIMPEALLTELAVEQWQWVLAHELAHIRRRDHMVRWVEWFARVCFWWNPVVWWAQRNLRAAEEICCDALVVNSLKPGRSTYASSLLGAMASLAAPIQRPPLMASEVNSGGHLERRFDAIVSGTDTTTGSRLLRACVLLFAVTVLPLGVVQAQNDRSDVEDYLNGVWTKLQQGVAAGSLSEEEARTRMAEARQAVRKRMEYAAMHARIQAAVEAGEMSEADARERIEGMKRQWVSGAEGGEEVAQAQNDRSDVEEYLEGVWTKLQQGVAAGSLSEEEARSRMAETEEAVQKRMEYAATRARIQAAVEAGEMSEADARERIEGMKRQWTSGAEGGEEQVRDEGEGSISIEEYRAAEKKFRKLVRDGKVSAEGAEIRLRQKRAMVSE